MLAILTNHNNCTNTPFYKPTILHNTDKMKMLLLLLLLTLFLPISLSAKFHHFRPTWITPDISVERHKRDTIDVSLIQDDHDYYRSTFDPNGFDTTWMEVADSVGDHIELSQEYFQYLPVSLAFKFPFYGHFIQVRYATNIHSNSNTRLKCDIFLLIANNFYSNFLS